MTNIHLLIVDHEEWFLPAVKSLLETEGIRVRTVASGADALRTINEAPVDVVILNVQMPGVNAMEILTQIKQKHDLAEVIMMADHSSVASAIEGIQSGAFDYVVQPCDISSIKGKICEAHKKKQCKEQEIRKSKIDRIISHPIAVFDNNDEDKE